MSQPAAHATDPPPDAASETHPNWPKAIGVLAVVLAVGVGVGAAVGGPAVGPVPLAIACVALAIGVQWVAFVPSYAAQTERYYDLTGALTTLSVLGLCLLVGASNDALHPRPLVVSAMAAIWALRLGTFLFRRIRADGKDGRFDAIKPNPARFLVAWSLQGLWVSFNLIGVIAIWSIAEQPPLYVFDWIGWALWALGFGIEVTADAQKSRFKENPANTGRWIDEGLWSYSRHPNYFGEITLWTGIFICGAGVFEGGQWAAAISPVFVTFLLTRVSGIPMLEERADARWGDDPEYRRYRASVSELVLRPRRAGGPDDPART